MLAYAPMTSNINIAGAMIVATSVYLFFRSRKRRVTVEHARWIPWVALVSGPAILFIEWGVHLRAVVGESPHAASDSVGLLGPGMLIATFVSALVALVFGAVLLLECNTRPSVVDTCEEEQNQ